MINFNKNRDWVENISIVTQVGLTMSGCILFCLLVGRMLDYHLNSAGVFVIIFIIFGIIGGISVCIRQIASVTALYTNTKSDNDK